VTRVRITRIGVGGLDDELAAALSAIDNAALDGVPLRHHTGRTFQLECQDRNGEGPDETVWLAHDDGSSSATPPSRSTGSPTSTAPRSSAPSTPTAGVAASAGRWRRRPSPRPTGHGCAHPPGWHGR
jgi:hypothetical protein